MSKQSSTSKDRFRPYASANLVLIKAGKVLLAKRLNTGWQDGKWELPSGHMDGDETVAEAAAREAKEEICVDIKPENLEVVYVLHRIAPDREYIDFYVKAASWKGEPKIGEEDKCEEVKWFPLDALPDKMVPNDKKVLQSLDSGFFSEYKAKAVEEDE